MPYRIKDRTLDTVEREGDTVLSPLSPKVISKLLLKMLKDDIKREKELKAIGGGI